MAWSAVVGLATCLLMGCTPSPPTASSVAERRREVLRAAQVSLPTEAKNVTFTAIEVAGYSEAYRLTFTVTRAEATAFCASDGLAGEIQPLEVLAEQDSALVGRTTVDRHSVGCRSQGPDDPTWNRVATYLDTDPTVVTLGVGRHD